MDNSESLEEVAVWVKKQAIIAANGDMLASLK